MHRRAARLLEKIESNSITIGVLGLGYVGLPLAVAFAKKAYRCSDLRRARRRQRR